MAVHLCVRVYASGEAKESLRDDEGLRSWMSFNREARPGNALFVDGVCAATDRGYLCAAHVSEIEALLATEIAGRPAERAIQKIAGQYPDDRRRAGFLLREATPVESRLQTVILEENWHVPDDVECMVPIRPPAR